MLEAGGESSKMAGGQALGLLDGLADGGLDKVLEHLHVLRVNDLGGDDDGLDLLLTVHDDLDGAAADAGLDVLVGQLFLGLGQHGLDILHLLHLTPTLSVHNALPVTPEFSGPRSIILAPMFSAALTSGPGPESGVAATGGGFVARGSDCAAKAGCP